MKYIIDIKGEIEGDYEIIGKYEERPMSERKKGKWVRQNPLVDTEECSECGYNIISQELETPFCPWCGADMRGGEE